MGDKPTLTEIFSESIDADTLLALDALDEAMDEFAANELYAPYLEIANANSSYEQELANEESHDDDSIMRMIQRMQDTDTAVQFVETVAGLGSRLEKEGDAGRSIGQLLQLTAMYIMATGPLWTDFVSQLQDLASAVYKESRDTEDAEAIEDGETEEIPTTADAEVTT